MLDAVNGIMISRVLSSAASLWLSFFCECLQEYLREHDAEIPTHRAVAQCVMFDNMAYILCLLLLRPLSHHVLDAVTAMMEKRVLSSPASLWLSFFYERLQKYLGELDAKLPTHTHTHRAVAQCIMFDHMTYI